MADECAYVYGQPLGSTGVPTSPGAAGTYYNQVINGDRYYTQDEFTNDESLYNIGDNLNAGSTSRALGCLQRPIAYAQPTITSISEHSGPQAGGTHLTITGMRGRRLSAAATTPTPSGKPRELQRSAAGWRGVAHSTPESDLMLFAVEGEGTPIPAMTSFDSGLAPLPSAAATRSCGWPTRVRPDSGCWRS